MSETSAKTTPWGENRPTALLVLDDGTVIEGRGAGATGSVEAEVCFNTAITGYQEILTDPSYQGQIVTFTFPHIGNVGTNGEDIEMLDGGRRTGAAGAIFREPITAPSSYRSGGGLEEWLKANGIVALCDIDTRALTAHIRETGLAKAVIAHDPDGEFDIDDLKQRAAAWTGLDGLDLVPDVTSKGQNDWKQRGWAWNEGYGDNQQTRHHVVAIDFGVKRNILRLFAGLDCKVTIVPSTTSADGIMALNPDGIFLSNGPGDPAATGDYAVPEIRELVDSGIPLFGICLGHQMLALALGGKTVKMHQGHHGANHPVKDHTTAKVEIVSMNHGFAVDGNTLPDSVEETHVSLFDGTNCGLRVKGKPVFSVQHHPEASPGPQDSHYLFQRFVDLMNKRKVSA